MTSSFFSLLQQYWSSSNSVTPSCSGTPPGSKNHRLLKQDWPRVEVPPPKSQRSGLRWISCALRGSWCSLQLVSWAGGGGALPPALRYHAKQAHLLLNRLGLKCARYTLLFLHVMPGWLSSLDHGHVFCVYSMYCASNIKWFVPLCRYKWFDCLPLLSKSLTASSSRLDLTTYSKQSHTSPGVRSGRWLQGPSTDGGVNLWNLVIIWIKSWRSAGRECNAPRVLKPSEPPGALVVQGNPNVPRDRSTNEESGQRFYLGSLAIHCQALPEMPHKSSIYHASIYSNHSTANKKLANGYRTLYHMFAPLALFRIPKKHPFANAFSSPLRSSFPGHMISRSPGTKTSTSPGCSWGRSMSSKDDRGHLGMWRSWKILPSELHKTLFLEIPSWHILQGSRTLEQVPHFQFHVLGFALRKNQKKRRKNRLRSASRASSTCWATRSANLCGPVRTRFRAASSSDSTGHEQNNILCFIVFNGFFNYFFIWGSWYLTNTLKFGSLTFKAQDLVVAERLGSPTNA